MMFASKVMKRLYLYLFDNLSSDTIVWTDFSCQKENSVAYFTQSLVERARNLRNQ